MKLFKILYANDGNANNLIEEYFNDKFKNLRFDVAETRKKTLDKINKENYDIIFYDLGMDEDYTFPFARKIKELRPKIPLVATSLALYEHKSYNGKTLNQIFNANINSIEICPFSPNLDFLLKRFTINLIKKIQ